MEISNLIPHIEALIFASDKPLTAAEITELVNQAFGFMEDKIAVEQIDASLEGIVEKYNSEFYPFEVRQSGGGWQFLTKKDFHKTVAQLNGEKFLKRLSSAALETLAIIAYKQPVTKGEIESIRGVSSDYAVQKLLEKELIVITGRNEKLPGHPLVYATSKSFMDYFGINSPEDLPKIREVLADTIVEPTMVNHTDFEQSETLAVSDNGELIAAVEGVLDTDTAENPEGSDFVNDITEEETLEDFIDSLEEGIDAAENEAVDEIDEEEITSFIDDAPEEENASEAMDMEENNLESAEDEITDADIEDKDEEEKDKA
jgi:segregation and condensation protein B